MVQSHKHSVKAGDIYLLDRPRLRASKHAHYVVVLEVQGDKAVVNFMSSEEQLFNEQRDIMLRTSDTEFGTTGLTKNTFVINQDYARIRVSVDRLFELKSKPVGYVSGYFKKRIEDYTGYAF